MNDTPRIIDINDPLNFLFIFNFLFEETIVFSVFVVSVYYEAKKWTRGNGRWTAVSRSENGLRMRVGHPGSTVDIREHTPSLSTYKDLDFASSYACKKV